MTDFAIWLYFFVHHSKLNKKKAFFWFRCHRQGLRSRIRRPEKGIRFRKKKCQSKY